MGRKATGDNYINIHTHSDAKINSEVAVKNILAHNAQKLPEDDDRYYSVGLHPYYILSADKDKSLRFIEKCATLPFVIAIGEAGIDRSIDMPLETQQEVFIAQLKIAEHLKKPIIIHCVRSYSDVLAIKKEYNSKVPWIVHGFNANIKVAEELIKHGCYLSFGLHLMKENSKAAITFPEIFPQKYFLETDETSLRIEKVYQMAASLKKKSIDEIKEQQAANFNNIFSLH